MNAGRGNPAAIPTSGCWPALWRPPGLAGWPLRLSPTRGVTTMHDSALTARGLYDPRFEHDACGIGFVAHLSSGPTHTILTQALTAVANMAHRGGINADG